MDMANPAITHKTDNGQRGIALVAVIWAISLLSLIAAAFVLNVRGQTQIARNAVDNAGARSLADAAVNIAIGELWIIGQVIEGPGHGTARRTPPDHRTASGAACRSDIPLGAAPRTTSRP